MIKNIFLTLFIVTIAIIQTSILSSFYSYGYFIHLVLDVILVAIWLFGLRTGLFLAIVGGLVLDAYSALPQGGLIIALLAGAYVFYLLFTRIFADRTLLSLGFLSIITLGVYSIFFGFIHDLYSFVVDAQTYSILSQGYYWKDMMIFILINTLIILIIAIGMRRIASKIKAVFILS